MSIEQTDAGGVTQRLSEKFKDLAVGGVSITVSENDKTLLKSDDERTEERKYGDCYIFDYQIFKKGEDVSRPGSENDVARLKHDFTALNFDVHCDVDNYLNLTKEDTLKALKKAAEKDHRQSKYFVCCFLTHGKKGELLMYDEYIKIDEILQIFSRSACETLSGKPKIFIFQACRGLCCERGVPPIFLPRSTTERSATESSAAKRSAPETTDFCSVKYNPNYLDFLIAYSTYDGKVSFRTLQNHGTYFIDELCRTIEQFSEKLDLLQILTITNYRVGYLFETSGNGKQMPCFTSGLRTEVKFSKKIEMYETCHTQYFDERRRKTSLGLESTGKPLEDEKIYNILDSERIKFLSLLNTRDNFENDLTYFASKLWLCVANKDYQREEKKNWSEKKLMNFLEEVSGRDFSSIDCLICFIACKAKGDYLYDVKGNKFLMQNIVEQFTGEKCRKLLGKPKIFIFLLSSPPKKSWFPCVSAESTDLGIPVHADILEITITIQESQQLDGVREKLCNIFGRASSEDFLSQLTRMNAELVKDYGFYSPPNKNLATFCLNSTLTKRLILATHNV